MSFDPSNYGPNIAVLLQDRPLNPLGRGSPNLSARAGLEALTAPSAFEPHHVRDAAQASACRAGLWLAHDFLEESHALSQEIDTPSGSYWHGLMHRREPDFGNAAYWFRQVGQHPVFTSLCLAAQELARAEKAPQAAFLVTQSTWDPFAFVKLCEAAYEGRLPCTGLCRSIQRAEWEILFDYCHRQAVGGVA